MQADLRAFHGYRLHGCTVFAALTAQNPAAVSAIHEVPSAFVAAQLDAVLGVYDIAALKTGMLSSPEVIAVVAERLKHHGEIKKVIDPVMIATSGARLVSEAAVTALKKELLPLATLITPNLPEAEALAGCASGSVAGCADCAEKLARALHGKFGCAVLVKGGHGGGQDAVDVLFDGNEAYRYSMPRLESPVSTHGTGCTLAAALAAELALGRGLAEAVAGAKRHVYAAIRDSYPVGDDCGVLGFVQQYHD